MKTKWILITGVLLFTSVFITGCIGVDGDFISLRHEIINSTGMRFQRNIEFSLGAVGLSVARVAVKFNKGHNHEVDVNEILNCVSRVQIGVYNNSPKNHYNSGFAVIKKIDHQMNGQGYQYIVKSCDHGEIATVYVRQNSLGKLSDMYVVSLNHEELVIVQIEGRLDKLLEAIIKDKGLDINFAANK